MSWFLENCTGICFAIFTTSCLLSFILNVIVAITFVTTQFNCKTGKSVSDVVLGEQWSVMVLLFLCIAVDSSQLFGCGLFYSPINKFRCNSCCEKIMVASLMVSGFDTLFASINVCILFVVSKTSDVYIIHSHFNN